MSVTEYIPRAVCLNTAPADGEPWGEPGSQRETAGELPENHRGTQADGVKGTTGPPVTAERHIRFCPCGQSGVSGEVFLRKEKMNRGGTVDRLSCPPSYPTFLRMG